MTENRRILLNIIATYGRSLFALFCGIFTSRWVLLSLGEIDYGLYGVVGGLAAFISFFNGVLASANARFYAVSVGAARAAQNKREAIVECQAWFNTAVSIHTVVPVVLMVIGYPLGQWAIESFLTIPTDRIVDCVWVFRFVCVTCFLSMVSVPFNAMYVAKQHIAELTIYSFVTTTVNVGFLYYMVTHPGCWLVRYGFWNCMVAVIPNLLIMVRAVVVFPECRFNRKQMFDFNKIRRLGSFACWQIIGMTSGLLRTQGMSVLINKFFGPAVNAAMAIGNSINGHANSLSGSMLGALSPAITNAYGAGDMKRMRSLVFTMCRFGVLLAMVFAIPLIVEMDAILKLWLRNPPVYASEFARLFLIQLLLENLTVGHMIAVNASGRIAFYHVMMGALSIMALPIAYVWMILGGNPYVSIVSIIITIVAYSLVRLWLSRVLVGLSIKQWIRCVAFPLIVVFVLALGAGELLRGLMSSSVVRIIVVTIGSECVLLTFSWALVLEKDEQSYIVDRLKSKISRVLVRKSV